MAEMMAERSFEVRHNDLPSDTDVRSASGSATPLRTLACRIRARTPGIHRVPEQLAWRPEAKLDVQNLRYDRSATEQTYKRTILIWCSDPFLGAHPFSRLAGAIIPNSASHRAGGPEL